MKKITDEIEKEIREMVYAFFADECDVEESELSDETNVLTDLDGDSLMLLELIEELKKKYDLNIQMQVLGKYILKHPVETIRRTIEVCSMIYEKENDINLEED